MKIAWGVWGTRFEPLSFALSGFLGVRVHSSRPSSCHGRFTFRERRCPRSFVSWFRDDPGTYHSVWCVAGAL